MAGELGRHQHLDTVNLCFSKRGVAQRIMLRTRASLSHQDAPLKSSSLDRDQRGFSCQRLIVGSPFLPISCLRAELSGPETRVAPTRWKDYQRKVFELKRGGDRAAGVRLLTVKPSRPMSRVRALVPPNISKNMQICIKQKNTINRFCPSAVFDHAKGSGGAANI